MLDVLWNSGSRCMAFASRPSTLISSLNAKWLLHLVAVQNALLLFCRGSDLVRADHLLSGLPRLWTGRHCNVYFLSRSGTVWGIQFNSTDFEA
jgi:hypothetical protein